METKFPKAVPPPAGVPAKMVYSVKKHSDAVLSLAFSVDRRIMAAGGRDGTACLWNIETGKPVERATIRAGSDRLTSLAFSPNNKHLAIGTSAGQISVQDVSEKTPQMVKLLRGTGSIDALAFSPDGRFLAGAGQDCQLRVWDLRKGSGAVPRAILPGHTKPVRTVAFGPDGRTLATGSQDATARLWTLLGLCANQRVSLPHRGEVNSVLFSTDGKTLLSAGADHVIWMWDCDATKPTALSSLSGFTGTTRMAVYSSDGNSVLSVGAACDVVEWNLRNGQPKAAWQLPANVVACVAMTPDSRYLGRGLENGGVEVFRVAEKRT